jgi:hypothetical protein
MAVWRASLPSRPVPPPAPAAPFVWALPAPPRLVDYSDTDDDFDFEVDIDSDGGEPVQAGPADEVVYVGSSSGEEEEEREWKEEEEEEEENGTCSDEASSSSEEDEASSGSELEDAGSGAEGAWDEICFQLNADSDSVAALGSEGGRDTIASAGWQS